MGRARTAVKVSIRRMRPGDYDPLIALWREAGLPCRCDGRDSRENLLHQLELPTSIYLVAEKGGEVVGAVLGTHDGRKGWINRLAVHPECQRGGVARKLVEEVERRLGTLGMGVMAALIEDWNEVSMKAFLRLGYEKHEDILYYSKRKDPKL